MGFITLSEYAEYTNTTVAAVTADYSATYVADITDVITELIKAYCLGTLFEATDITDERNKGYVRGRRPQTAKLMIKLKYTPINSVSTIKYRIGSTDTELSTNNLDYDPETGILNMWWYGPTWRLQEPWVTLTSYNVGYSSVPIMVKQACALLVREWITADSQIADGASGVVTEYKIGNYQEKYSIDEARRGDIGLGTADTLRARNLLRKYRRVGVK